MSIFRLAVSSATQPAISEAYSSVTASLHGCVLLMAQEVGGLAREVP